MFTLHLRDRAKAAAFPSAHKERPLVRTPTKASGQAAQHQPLRGGSVIITRRPAPNQEEQERL